MSRWWARVGPQMRRSARRLRRLPVLSLPTPTGGAVLVGSIVALVIGAAAHWAEAALAGAVGAVVLLLCGAFTVGRTNVRIEISVARRRLSAGQTTTARVNLVNQAHVPLLPVELRIPVGTTTQTFPMPLLGGGAARDRTFEVPGLRRGVIPIGPVTTVRSDPFGLLARTITWTGVEEVFVHPEVIDVRPIGAGLRHDLEGRTGTQLSSSDLAFHTLRDYVPGDDRRHIHWRSSAKVSASASGGRFLVRQFLETRRTHVLVIVDGNRAAYADSDEFEIAISAGASVAIQAVRDKLEATILAADHVSTDSTREQVLDTCARAALVGTDLPTLVGRALQVAPQATAVFLVTGSTPDFPALRRAAARVPSGLPTTVLQIKPSGRRGVSTGGVLTVLTLRELRDLRAVLDGGGVS